MRRTLILMRHAKSSWADPALDDHDRPLNRRGRRSAAAIGQWLAAKGVAPDLALVSTALRTRQTFDGLGLGCAARLDSALYHAAPETLMSVLRPHAAVPCLLLMGHNPGLAHLAHRLVSRPPAHPRFLDFPTGAVLVATVQGALDWRGAEPVAFAIPRELLAAQA